MLAVGYETENGEDYWTIKKSCGSGCISDNVFIDANENLYTNALLSLLLHGFVIFKRFIFLLIYKTHHSIHKTDDSVFIKLIIVYS